MHFASVFARTLEDFSRAERTKYAEVYEPGAPDEVVVTPRDRAASAEHGAEIPRRQRLRVEAL